MLVRPQFSQFCQQLYGTAFDEIELGRGKGLLIQQGEHGFTCEDISQDLFIHWHSGLFLQSPNRVQLFRRPELEQGQTCLTQTVRVPLCGFYSHGLPRGNLEAPALWRWGCAFERQGTVGASFIHGMSVTPFTGFAKDEEG